MLNRVADALIAKEPEIMAANKLDVEAMEVSESFRAADRPLCNHCPASRCIPLPTSSLRPVRRARQLQPLMLLKFSILFFRSVATMFTGSEGRFRLSVVLGWYLCLLPCSKSIACTAACNGRASIPANLALFSTG